MSADNIIKLENVNKKFLSKGAEVLAVKNINLEIKKGVVLCQDLVQVKMRNFAPF